jgi:type IV secretory pathway VirB10-like protein
MRPPQIVALGLGATVVAVGAGLVWHQYRASVPMSQPVPFAEIEPTKPASQAAPQKPPEQTSKAEPAMPPEAAVPQPAADLASTVPQFDTVRVEPSGDAVVAGHGAPGAQVALLANGKPIANEASDGAGKL